MNPGVYEITSKEYHASAGVSRSKLIDIKDPLTYYKKHVDKDRKPKIKTRDMIIGNLVHTLVLEPLLADAEYIVKEKINGATKEGKKYNAEFKLLVENRDIVESDDCTLSKKMAEEILKYQIFTRMTEGAKIEKSIYWVDEESGLLCKARPDIWNDNLDLVCDLKTNPDCDVDSINGHVIKKYGYHMQAAMQLDAIASITGKVINNFYFLLAGKEQPFMPRVLRLREGWIELGRKHYKDALKILNVCMKTNLWSLDREKIYDIEFEEHHAKNDPYNKLKEVYSV